MERSKNVISFAPISQYGNETQESQYEQARKVWDDRLLNVRGHVDLWRKIALLALVATIVSLLGNIILGYLLRMKPTAIPYVVEIGLNGETNYVGDVGIQYEGYVLSEKVIEYRIKEFVRNIRSRSKDAQVIREQWVRSLGMSSQAIQRYLLDLAEVEDVLNVQENPRRSVGFTDYIKTGENTYVIFWRETIFSDSGISGSEKRYRAAVEVAIILPENEEELERNPLSVYIGHFEMKEMKNEFEE